jgi:hypothetical protein
VKPPSVPPPLLPRPPQTTVSLPSQRTGPSWQLETSLSRPNSDPPIAIPLTLYSTVSKSVGSLASSASPSTASSATTNDGSGSSQPTSHATLVHNLFEGTLTSETRCLTCETVSPQIFHHTPNLKSDGRAHMGEGALHRYHPGMSRFWTSQSILSRTRPSRRASGNSARARCSASGTNSSATRAVGSKKPKSA